MLLMSFRIKLGPNWILYLNGGEEFDVTSPRHKRIQHLLYRIGGAELLSPRGAS